MTVLGKRRKPYEVPHITGKMNREALTGLFPAYDPSKFIVTRATNKGFFHKVNPTFLPKKAKLTPAQWGRKRRGEPAPYNYRGAKK